LTEVTQACEEQSMGTTGPAQNLTCQVTCPDGYTVISGGFNCLYTGSSGSDPGDSTCDADLYVKESRPLPLGSGWVATWRNIGTTPISAEVVTYAYCAIIEGCSVSNPVACEPPDPP
jgi:hypothetical protein